MKFHVALPMLALTAMFAQSSVWAAAAGEKWTAVSTTAMGVTGDVRFAPDRITFGNGKSLPLAPAGTVPKFGAPTEQVNATLYRVTTPADPILLHGSRLCGGRGPQPVTFIAIWKPARIGSDIDPRNMAAFSGSAPPAAAGGQGFCGTYNFEAGAATPRPARPLEPPRPA